MKRSSRPSIRSKPASNDLGIVIGFLISLVLLAACNNASSDPFSEDERSDLDSGAKGEDTSKGQTSLVWRGTLGESSIIDYASDLRITKDGDYIVCGGSLTLGAITERGRKIDPRILLSKTNEEIVWTSAIHPKLGSIELANDVFENYVYENSNGVLIVASIAQGQENELGEYTGSDVKLHFLDSKGKLLNSKVISNQSEESVSDLLPLSNGGFAIAGSRAHWEKGTGGGVVTEVDMFVMKFDEQGQLVWDSTIKKEGLDSVTGMDELKDGSIVVCGMRRPPWMPEFETDATVIKLDASGTIVWTTEVGQSDEFISASSVVSDDDGNIYVLTYEGILSDEPGDQLPKYIPDSRSFSWRNLDLAEDVDCTLVMLSGRGDEVWKRRIQLSSSFLPQHMILGSEKCFGIIGETLEKGVRSDVSTLVVLDSEANIKFSKDFTEVGLGLATKIRHYGADEFAVVGHNIDNPEREIVLANVTWR